MSPRAQNKARDSEPDSLLRMAESFLAGNDYAGALSLFNQHAVANPGDPRPLVGMADIYWRLGRRDLASQYYRRILVMEPNNSNAAAGIAVNMIHSGRPKSAISFINEFIGTSPGTAALFNTLGVAYDLTGAHDGAHLAYADGLDLSPEDPEILNNLALSFAVKGDYETAISLLRRVLDGPGSDSQGRQNLALIYALSGQLDTAAEIAATVLSDEEVQRNKAFYSYLPGLSRAGKAEAVFLGRLPVPGAEPEKEPEMKAESDEEPLFQTEMTAQTESEAPQKPKTAAERAAEIVNTPDPVRVEAKSEPEPEPEPEPAVEVMAEMLQEEASAEILEEVSEQAPAESVEEMPQDMAADRVSEPVADPVPVVEEPKRETTAAERAAEIVNAPDTTSETVPEIETNSATDGLAELLSEGAEVQSPEDALAAAIDAELENSALEADVMTPEVKDGYPKDRQETADVASATAPVPETEAVPEYAPYWVQLGSYGSMERVHLGWETLNRSHGTLLEGYEGYAQRRELEEGTVIRYRLMVDAYETRDAAGVVCAAFKEEGMDCLVIKTSDDISPLELDVSAAK